MTQAIKLTTLKQNKMGTLVTIADSKIDRLFTELSNLTKGTEIIDIRKEDFNKSEMMISVNVEFESEARIIIENCKFKMSAY